MNRKLWTLSLIAVTMSVLAGCASIKKATSSERQKPDEFAIYSQPKLDIPPEFTLRPPQPGAPITRTSVSPSKVARDALLNSGNKNIRATTTLPAGTSPGLLALLQQTGALNTNPNIRSEINAELTNIADEDERLINKMIFWVDDQPYQGTIVDAEKEQKRILQNQALGKDINEGETPQVVRKRKVKGFLDF